MESGEKKGEGPAKVDDEDDEDDAPPREYCYLILFIAHRTSRYGIRELSAPPSGPKGKGYVL